MLEPRVILADPELSYLLPLQYCFAEQFGDRISLELIDDPLYLRELFSEPQSADILVIRDGLCPDLRIHDVRNVFVLTERQPDMAEERGPFRRVYRYSSIKEVFNRISAPLTEAEQAETKVLAVCSAAGGLGKTTLALGLCGCLASSGKKVLYLNAAELQIFQHRMQNKSCLSSREVIKILLHPGDSVYGEIRHVLRLERFSYLPAFQLALPALGLKYSVFEDIAVSAKTAHEYDYIVVDTETGFREENSRLMGLADKVILVTGPDVNSVQATNRFLENVQGVPDGKYCFILNNREPEAGAAANAATAEKKYSPDDFVEYLGPGGALTAEDGAKAAGIQRLAVLVM